MASFSSSSPLRGMISLARREPWIPAATADTLTSRLFSDNESPREGVKDGSYPLRGGWSEGKYVIHVNWDNIRKTEAKLTIKREKINCSVVWHFPILDQKKLLVALKLRESPFTVKVVPAESGQPFTVHVYCRMLKDVAQAHWQELNKESLSPGLLKDRGRWVAQSPDRKEHQRFYMRKLQKSKKLPPKADLDAYPKGPMHAATILYHSGASLAGKDLIGIKICGAKIPGVLFRNAHLQDADLRECDLSGRSLRGKSSGEPPGKYQPGNALSIQTRRVLRSFSNFKERSHTLLC